MRTEKTILKGNYALTYVGTDGFVYGKEATLYSLELVDGVRAGTMNSIAVGVNKTHILYKGENNRVHAKDVFWVVKNKETGEQNNYYERPKGMRFTKIESDFTELK